MHLALTVEHVCGGYRERNILDDVSFGIEAGERVLLIGPNGCGKTTLLKMIVGALPTQSGRVLFDGQDLSRVPLHIRVQAGFGYLMQTRNVFPSLSVDENLHLSYWHGDGDFGTQRDRLLDMFPMLKNRLSRRAGLLSGGERQALAICMVMMRPVKLLFLDEPTAGLAPKAAEEILQAVQRAQEHLGYTSLTVEHNLRLIHRWVSRVLVMRQGRLVSQDVEPSALLDHDRLQGYYFE